MQRLSFFVPLLFVSLLTAPAASQDEAVDHARSLSRAFRRAADRAKPTVVKITTITKAREIRRGGGGAGRDNPFQGTPFEDFFNEDELDRFFQQGPGRPRNGLGSGVVISNSGLILTNNHVVDGADEVLVRLSDGREFKGRDIRTDKQTDLAILRIDAGKELPFARLGDSDRMEIGDWVIAIGHPFELEATVSAGIISGKGRSLGSVRRAQFLQTDAAINPGNSGGPLVNLDGQVVGINTAIASNSGGYQGIGFAIPANLAKWVIAQLNEKGRVQRAYLGVGIEELSAELAQNLGFQRGAGVIVSEIFPDTPATKAGVQEGDLITTFNGVRVGSPRELQSVVERSGLKTRLPMRIVRDGRAVTLQVVLEELPREGMSSSAPSRQRREPSTPESQSIESLGIQISELDDETAQQLGYRGYKGVLITEVDSNSTAYRKGLRAQMLILRVGRQRVESVTQFKAALRDETGRDGVLLQVRAGGGNRFVVIDDD